MLVSHRCIIFLLLLLVIAACTSSGSIITAEATDTRSVLNADKENLLTSTSSPGLVPIQTQIGSYQPLYDATQSIVQTKIAGFPSVCRERQPYPILSPNGEWLAELCHSENDRDLVMALSNSETQILWKLLYRDYIPTMDQVPDGGMSVVRWSRDERYAYFNSFMNASGGECFDNGSVADSGWGLFRLDLKTGKITTLLPPGNTYSWWYRFSFSPTDRRLVYGARGTDLKIFDVQTGHIVSVVHVSDFHDGGGYIWSADGLQFVYSTVTTVAQGERFRYSVRLVDAQTGSEQILLESLGDCLAVMSWAENNHLIVEKNYNAALIEFSLNSNQIISEATMTPYP